MGTTTLPARRRLRASAIRRASEGDQLLRVAIVAETFLPATNGVTNSVIQVAAHLRARGHEVVIVAPGPGEPSFEGCPIVRVPAVEHPRYPDLHVGRPTRLVGAALKDFGPDVVHVAAPVVLGALALRWARKCGVPSVAIYQTDLAGFAERYGFRAWSAALWRWIAWTHQQADLTLAPSTAALWDLRHRGVDNVARWARGVDTGRFAPWRRCNELRASFGAPGRVLVGYVGRLAKEKQIDRLAPLLDDPSLHVVIVGEGPARGELERSLPGATFVGFKRGDDLARHVAALDVFVHTGIDETFCQALQEAMASGVPAVAPAAGGPLDLVQHGVNGFLWNPRSPVALVGGVHELANSALLREQMGQAARASVEGRTWSAIIDELEGHYRATISGLAFAYGAVAR
jgi:phosphatidylinositol alpha 1,6-mannosyltransferase